MAGAKYSFFEALNPLAMNFPKGPKDPNTGYLYGFCVGLGLMVWGLGSMVWGLGPMVW